MDGKIHSFELWEVNRPFFHPWYEKNTLQHCLILELISGLPVYSSSNEPISIAGPGFSASAGGGAYPAPGPNPFANQIPFGGYPGGPGGPLDFQNLFQQYFAAMQAQQQAFQQQIQAQIDAQRQAWVN